MSIYNEFITLFEKFERTEEHEQAPVVPLILNNYATVSSIAETIRNMSPQEIHKWVSTPAIGSDYTKMALCPSAVNLNNAEMIEYFEGFKKFYLYLYDKICKTKDTNFNLYFEGVTYNSANKEHQENFKMAVNKNIVKIGKFVDYFLITDNKNNVPHDDDKPKRGKPKAIKNMEELPGEPITTVDDFKTFLDEMVDIFNLPANTPEEVFKTMTTPSGLIRDAKNLDKVGKEYNGIKLTGGDSISRIFTYNLYNNSETNRFQLIKMLNKQINDANKNELETIYNFLDTLLPQEMKISVSGDNISADKTIKAYLENFKSNNTPIVNKLDLFNQCSSYIQKILSNSKIEMYFESDKYRSEANDEKIVDLEKRSTPINELKSLKSEKYLKPLDISVKMLLFKAIAKKTISFQKSTDEAVKKYHEKKKTSEGYGYSEYIPLQWIPRIKELISVAYSSANDYRKNGATADTTQFFTLSELFQKDVQTNESFKFSPEELDMIKTPPSSEEENYQTWEEKKNILIQDRNRIVTMLCGGGSGGKITGILNNTNVPNKSVVRIEKPYLKKDTSKPIFCSPLEAVFIKLGDSLTEFLYGKNTQETVYLARVLNKLAAPDKFEYLAQTTVFSTVDFINKLYFVDKQQNINVPELINVPLDGNTINPNGVITYNNPEDTETKNIVSDITASAEVMCANIMGFQKTLPSPNEELNDCIKGFVTLFDLDPHKFHPISSETQEKPIKASSVADLARSYEADAFKSEDEKLDDTKDASINIEGE